jgi:ABC-type nitrate/sulfonate/bicarbonate transport system substrate-binding protein
VRFAHRRAKRCALSNAAKRKILNDSAHRLYRLSDKDAMLNKHRMILTALGFVVLLTLRPPTEAQAENIKIGIPSLSVTTMPLAVAKEQGFFQKEGLNVDIVMMPASLNIKVLLTGEIQYATTVGSAVVAAVRGINTRVVMCFVDRPLLDLVGTPDIRSLSDLRGKLLGISSRGGLHDVSMRAILTQSGIDPSQVTLLTVGTQGSMFAALKSGRISAGLLNPPQNFIAYREGLKNLAFAGNYVRLPSTGLVSMKDTLERSPDQIRRMIRALTRARAFARENKAATITVLKRFLRIDDEDLAAKIYDYHKRAETPDGKIDAALASETIRETRQAEGITREIPVNQVFDFSYVDSAN